MVPTLGGVEKTKSKTTIRTQMTYPKVRKSTEALCSKPVNAEYEANEAFKQA